MAYGTNTEADWKAASAAFCVNPWPFGNSEWSPESLMSAASSRSGNIEPLWFTALDGRELGGYKLRAANPRGYLLVAQGNAMLADQMMGVLTYFRDAGLDVYVYDYRGYGLSTGKSRLQAIVSDYRGARHCTECPRLPPPLSLRHVYGRRHPD